MALSGSFENAMASTAPGSGYILRVVWNATHNVENNTSTIVCDFYLVQKPRCDIDISVRNNNTCVIDGVTLSWSSPAIDNTDTKVPDGAVTKIGSCSHVVKHNDDGSKSLTIKARYAVYPLDLDIRYSEIVATANITLDPILRGLVHIDTGSGFVKAIPYIDDGTEWKRCIPYVDDGSAFKMCSG